MPPYTNDLEAKEYAIRAMCNDVGITIQPGWVLTVGDDVDPGGTAPTDPPPPKEGDLDTTGKVKTYASDSLKRLLAEVRIGHPGS